MLFLHMMNQVSKLINTLSILSGWFGCEVFSDIDPVYFYSVYSVNRTSPARGLHFHHYCMYQARQHPFPLPLWQIELGKPYKTRSFTNISTDRRTEMEFGESSLVPFSQLLRTSSANVFGFAFHGTIDVIHLSHKACDRPVGQRF